MADCIEERISANIEAALATVQTYPAGALVTVERERMFLTIGDRYPFIELGGPYAEVDTVTYRVEMTDLFYVVKYYVNVGDENKTADSELPYLTRNVCADIEKVLKLDEDRGDLAEFTKVTDHGYDFDEGDQGQIEFFRYLVLQVRSRIDATDPYLLG